MNASIQGGMLRIARQRLGLSQKEAADLLGISQASLSQAEHQIREVPEGIAERAEKVYRLPKPFFYQTDAIYGPPVSVHPAMWRKKSTVSTKELDRIVSDLNVRVIHMRRLLDAADIIPTTDIPRLDIDEHEDPETIAGIVRAHWKTPLGPVTDLTGLAEAAGVMVVHSKRVQSTVDGVTFAVPGLPPLIALNSDQPADRMRFTLAHEIGHLVMHRFPTRNMEAEANTFAGALLLPGRELRLNFAGRRVDLALLASLKPIWKVSMQSLLMRARELDIISPDQARYLWKQISQRKMRLREPPELDFPIEAPQTMRALFDFHIESLGYTIDDLAHLLCMGSSELADFHGLHPKPANTKGPHLRLL